MLWRHQDTPRHARQHGDSFSLAAIILAVGAILVVTAAGVLGALTR